MNPSRVCLFDAVDRSFRQDRIEVTDLRRGEARVRVTCCTICGSDLHTATGRRTGPSPCVLGHEIVGVVESASVDPLLDYFGNLIQIGQRITWGLTVGCGHCFFCHESIPQKCDSVFKYGHVRFEGQRAFGGLAEHCYLTPGTSLFSLPDELPDSVACPANCATATVHATLRAIRELMDIRNKTVLITGMGMLGLTACAWLKELNVGEIICVDVDHKRLELARDFGATQIVLANNEKDLVAVVDRATDGRGADAALELSGTTVAAMNCLNRLRVGGVLILAGSVFPSEPLNLSTETIVRKMLNIRGVHNYRPDDLAAAIDFLISCHHKYPFHALVQKSFGLDDVESAFALAKSGSAIRVAVTP